MTDIKTLNDINAHFGLKFLFEYNVILWYS